MCGVIGLVFENDRDDMGELAAELLRALEYRGYDSTGAAVQSTKSTDVALRKGVGAPSKVCEPLGITKLKGSVFCGQVRWATFGAVDVANAQPHVVDCKAKLFGAHNGNVTNCDDLQTWLRAVGHDVKSDNDGEMVVHTVEHCFATALELRDESERLDPAVRRATMRAAIVEAGGRLEGSYAAVIVDRLTRVAWSVKAGSSLYCGLGHDPEHGPFTITSSDLSCVLKTTLRIVPLDRGEFVEMTPGEAHVYCLRTGEPRPKEASRSKLIAHEVELREPFKTFMDQEISAQPQTIRDVVRAFHGGSERAFAIRPALETLTENEITQIEDLVMALRSEVESENTAPHLDALRAHAGFSGVIDACSELTGATYLSAERALLEDLQTSDNHGATAALDAWLEVEETDEFSDAVREFVDTCAAAHAGTGRIYSVCCGSSFHAAKLGSMLFAEIAGTPLTPAVPGDFRAQIQPALRDGDVIIVVSQSGETKDVVDILTKVRESGRSIAILSLVNNINSTIAQELADVVIPLRCGPEIAVPATKSFVNQLALFHGLACELGRRTFAEGPDSEAQLARVDDRLRLLERMPGLIERTVETTRDAVETAAELLYLRPSSHILGTRMSAVALEGALKIREVVLNHTQGYEAAEFKHGPNTILGRNTLYGPEQIRALLAALGDVDPSSVFAEPTSDLLDSLTSDYPLIYVTGPGTQDVAVTISQVNTHKIRGAVSIAIAEEDAALRQAIEKAPSDNASYQSLFIAVPSTGDFIGTMYTATVVMQRLALRMSEKKAAYLDAAGIEDHGVHPDVPKNVSKSITVD